MSMSESLLQVIKLPLEVYHYFEYGIEQDKKCTALLIKQEIEWIEWLHSFSHKCPALATRSLLSFFILNSTLLWGEEVWK